MTMTNLSNPSDFECTDMKHIQCICHHQRSKGLSHDDVIKWKHFPCYWPFVRGIHRSPVNFPHVTQSFDVFFDLRLNKRLSKQKWCWWFETLSRPLWRHRNVFARILVNIDRVTTGLAWCVLLDGIHVVLHCTWVGRRYCAELRYITW